MVIVMICKFCGKNISGNLFICNKCLVKYKNVKQTYLPNGIEYITNVLTSFNYSNDDHHKVPINCVADVNTNISSEENLKDLEHHGVNTIEKKHLGMAFWTCHKRQNR